MARAILHLRADDPDESAHVLVPRIEAMVRTLATAVGVATFTLPTEERAGGYVGLKVLFDRLRPRGLPDAWRRYGEHCSWIGRG